MRITEYLRNLYSRLKQMIKENPYKVLAFIGIAGFFLIKYFRRSIPEVKLSYFLALLKNNGIRDCVVIDEKVYFKGIAGSKWFIVNIGMLTKDMVYQLLLSRDDLNVTCRKPIDTEKYVVLGSRTI